MKNNIKYLIGLFLILLLASYFVIKNKDVKSENETTYLIPELKTQINDVDSIILSKNEKTISLSKTSGTWRIKEANNYLADANMIANLLLDLRKFELKEQKTSKPEKFSQLTLDDKGENAATQIKLRNADQQFADVFIGKKAQNSQGIYVRKNNQEQAWLSEGSVNIKLNPNDWIVTTILDINSDQIKSVTFNSEGKEFTIDKITPQDSDFGLVDMPESMKLKSNVNLNDLAIGLQKFNIESASIRQDISEQPLLSVTYQLFSGMKYHLYMTKVEEIHYLNIDLENVDSSTENNLQLENWTYVIPAYKFEAFNKKLTDLLEPISEISSSDSVNQLNQTNE